MRVLLSLLLFVVLSGCGSPEPVAEPVAEKAIDPQPVAPKSEAQPAAAQPENPKNNPAPDTVAPQQAPVKPPANPQPVQPPVVERPQQPVAPSRAPGKVPLLVSVRAKTGKKHVGELIERTDAGLVVYDIVLRDTVSITKDQVQSFVEGIDERSASSHVPFATFAAWKLTKLLRIGTVQGRIALASDKGIFINLGSAHGLSAGQSVTLLGKAKEITDPESDEQLAVYRAPVATLKILTVVNERLSKLSIAASDTPIKIERGMTVSCERGSTTVVVIPPQWKSEGPNLKTGDEALYLTEHILAELVRFGVPVISRDQVEQAQAELSQKAGKPVATLPAATVGQTLKAGVLLTGQILAKGQTGNVTLHVTDLATRQYVGILAGRIRRDKIEAASAKAKRTSEATKKAKTKGINKKVTGRRPSSAISPFSARQAKTLQQAWAAYLGTPIETTNSIGMKFKLIPPGEFRMGSPSSERGSHVNEKPVHRVQISKPFYLGVYEVTQRQFEEITKARPWDGKSFVQVGPEYPATWISYGDAETFCLKLSAREGVGYRLPTEAQWEFACRAGSITAFNYGSSATKLGNFAWYAKNAFGVMGEQFAHRVGLKSPNPFGLYDTHGNVVEWCQDGFGPYRDGEPLVDPLRPPVGSFRVARGGGFLHQPHLVRSASRYSFSIGTGYTSSGFRVVRMSNLPASQPKP